MAKTGNFRNEVRIVGLKELTRELAKAFPKNQIGNKLRQATMTATKTTEHMAAANMPLNRHKKGHYVPKWANKPGTKGRMSLYGPEQASDGYWVWTPFARDQVKRKSKTKKSKTGGWTAIGVHPDAFYATQFVEVGTNRGGPGGKLPGQDPQPWLETALRGTSTEVRGRLAKSIRNMVKRQQKKTLQATRAAK